MTIGRTRWPKRVFGAGVEPDPRFTLANERTFLAGVRTALALLAVAVALLALNLPMHVTWQYSAAALFALTAAVSAGWALVSWAVTEHALRLARPLSGLAPDELLAVAVVLGTALPAVGFVLGWAET